MTRPAHIVRTLSFAGVFLAAMAIALAGNEKPKEIGRTTEKELHVVLSSSFGGIHISRGEAEKVLIAESVSSDDNMKGMNIDYTIRNRVGYLTMTIGEEVSKNERRNGGFKLGDLEGGTQYLQFSNALPISFDVELGVGKGNFDLSGLQVKDFTLSTGASDVTLSFNEPNRSTIDVMNIESGVSKFYGENLGNANFKRLKFQGGVGKYTLDFSGELKNEVDVDVEVGLGVLTIVIPENVGAKVYYEKSWVSRLDTDPDFHAVNDNEYTTDNYRTARGRMNLRIDSGLGSVKVRRK